MKFYYKWQISSFLFLLVMRSQGSLRVILNTKIWTGMTVERASQKTVRITAADGDGIKVFLIVVSSYHIIAACIYL